MNINNFNHQISDFSIISSDCDLELLCDSLKFLLFKQAVTFAINYMLDEEEGTGNDIPDGLFLYVSKKDNIVALKKNISSDAVYSITEPLQAWIDLLKEEAELFSF